MARKVFSTELRKKLIERSRTEHAYKTRFRQLYNYIYKHSSYYRISYVVRMICLVLSLYILNFNKLVTSVNKETISDARVDEFHIGKKNGNMENRDLILSTTSGNEYAIGFTLSESDMFLKNDVIEVVKNAIGKTTYIVNTQTKHWNQLSKLRRFDNFLIFVALSTLLSLLVFDGYELLYRVYIRIILGLDILTILFYLVL